MQLTSRTTHSLLSHATVTIDWSALQPNVEAQYNEHDIDTLIDWVKCQQRRGRIHVVLRRHPLTATRTRLLQKSLQSLGCTVIAKMQLTTHERHFSFPTSFSSSEWQ